jgi:hypothetical protein
MLALCESGGASENFNKKEGKYEAEAVRRWIIIHVLSTRKMVSVDLVLKLC